MGRTLTEIARRIAYVPLPSQKRFHDLQTQYKGFSGPIGSGKSQALCHEAIRMSYLNQGRMGLLGAPTYPMLRDVTQATLFNLLDKNQIPYDFSKAENMLVMADTGSKIVFRPVEEFERLRGTNLAWFGVDELTYTQEEAWVRLEGRLRDPEARRLCGFAVWTPKGFDWVYRRFIVKTLKQYGVVCAQPLENRYMLEKIPEFYKQLQESYDPAFYRQEVMGEYLNITGGKVYAEFNREEHVTNLNVDPNLPLLWALDFNVDPMSSILAQKLGSTIHVVDEVVIRHGTTPRACEAFLKRYPNHKAGVKIYGDASGNSQQTTGSSDYDMIRDYFAAHASVQMEYKVPQCNPSVRDRINLVNAMLRSSAGTVRLLIDVKCNELIQDFEQVSYKEDTAQIDKDRDRLRTHVSDALGYLIWRECKSAPTIGERGGPLV